MNGTTGLMAQNLITIIEEIRMELNTVILSEKIHQYLDGQIEKEKFAEWAKESSWKMLKGEIFELKKIVLWRFVSLLEQTNACCEPTTHEEIKAIGRILDGHENALYIFNMKISKEYCNPEITDIRNLLTKRKNGADLNDSEIGIVERFSKKKRSEITTIQEMLEEQLACLLDDVYSFYVRDEEMIFDLKHTVFVDERDVIEANYLLKIFRLMGYCTGDDIFTVYITYDKGCPSVLLI